MGDIVDLRPLAKAATPTVAEEPWSQFDSLDIYIGDICFVSEAEEDAALLIEEDARFGPALAFRRQKKLVANNDNLVAAFRK